MTENDLTLVPITRTSMYSGITRTREILLNEDDLRAWQTGQCRLIQNAMPYLSADDREFIMTGIIQQEWDSIFPEGEEGSA